MCRNIKPLFNFEPAASDEEVRAAALQFVRKISGYNAPSAANQEAFERAVDEVAAAAQHLLAQLTTHAHPRNRQGEGPRSQAFCINQRSVCPCSGRYRPPVCIL